jgi:dipeptidase E
MRFLLTSCGVTNPSIARALFELVGKQPAATSLAFVPTAANVEQGDKGWLIDDLVNLKRLNFKSIDVADISAIEKKLWLSKMEEADVLYFAGGKRYHLMQWAARSGLAEVLPDLLESRVYVGMSAGSMITSERLGLRFSHILYGDDLERTEDIDGLGFVDFYFLPHLNNPYFSNLKEGAIKESVKGMSETIYALDDASALKIIDREVNVVSEGTVKVFRPGRGST